jgi:mono/diheme cytochrome c family protein
MRPLPLALALLGSATVLGCNGGGAMGGLDVRAKRQKAPPAPTSLASEAPPVSQAPGATPTTLVTTTAAGAGAGGAAPSAAAAAEQVFTSLCATCHGAGGHGDGALAASLNPKPRDYSDATWQASVTDEHIAKVIVGGGLAVGKSPLMPPNPDLANKPDVVQALVAKVRGFRPR